jgi:hypothetical protein
MASLATWRLTHLIVEEDGPADVVVHVRRRAGDGMVGAAMDCFHCCSVWAGAAEAAAGHACALGRSLSTRTRDDERRER